MPLTRSFKETVRRRAVADPAFREALLQEAVQALLQGDAAVLEALIAWARRGPRLAQVDELRDEPPRAHDDRPYAGFEIWPSA